MPSPILLIGATGQVGWELRRVLAPLAPLEVPGHAQFDLSDEDHVRRQVRVLRPALIVNAAAYTDVDGAEQSEREAIRLNGKAPGWLAEEAADLGIPLVHYSTDYVFGGESRRSCPYSEMDVPAPINVYGDSKLMGERAVAASGADYLIFRTSWVYARRGKNFLATIRRIAAEQDELRVVNDQIGAPTWARSVAEATGLALSRIWRPKARESLSGQGGLYHLSASGTTSWHGFATEIVEVLHRRGEANLRVKSIEAIGSDEIRRPADRPRYSVLGNDAIQDALAIQLPDWRTQLESCLSE